MNLSIAISPCPNDVFIFAGLITGAVRRPGYEFAFEFLELESLNAGAREGRWEIAKISYANAAGLPGYRLLRCGGALGRGCGPLLLANRAGAEGKAVFDPSAPVLVPGQRTTAHLLLEFFHRNGQVTGGGSSRPDAPLRKAFVPFDALYRRLLGSEPCQGVVIHEMRFTYARDGLFLVRDLGEFWESATGHPIPLGAVALALAAEARAPGLGIAVEDAIRASLDWSYAHEAEALALCRHHSQSMDESVLRSHIALYVNAFSRDLGPEGDRAVAHFLELQARFSLPDPHSFRGS
ncbi:MAG: 1,4-dihydroxy-6-naphthoate synthase [Fibrobacteres bacterium]|jgi:1,4-dihydroxy-6-naphthoate synthase|nr:1,4-dihydroxy-6-naphthoate synthase [Fibrobacterota bacterium]